MAERKRARKDKDSLRRLFEEKRHIGGRLPDITQPTPEPPAPPVTPPAQPARAVPRPPRQTGLYLLLPRGGFTHHPENGFYLMMPKEFKAILALEKKAVAQVVYEIIDQTIGWEDPKGRGGRREWAKLSLRHFQQACGMSLSQVQQGLKIALQQGYILRRPVMGEFEYTIHWRDSESAT
jgi:hypothetical protein